MSKITVSIIIIAVIIVAAVLYSGSQPAPGGVAVPTVITHKAAPAHPVPDTSNASVNSDVSAIDAQMTSLNADTANINKSINDQPIDPTL